MLRLHQLCLLYVCATDSNRDVCVCVRVNGMLYVSLGMCAVSESVALWLLYVSFYVFIHRSLLYMFDMFWEKYGL